MYSQTCIKRSPLGQRKDGLKRGSIHMTFSMTGQGKSDLLIEVAAWAGLTVLIFDRFRFIVFNATFNNISVISWQSVLLVEETGVPGEKPPTCR